MTVLKLTKTALIGGFAIALFWTAFGKAVPPARADSTLAAPPTAAAPEKGAPEDYVGSESCKACHEDQFKSFSHTAHAKPRPHWKAEQQGCESCHGPGKAHIEGGGDKTKIHTFEGESTKKISETCLSCHSGKEEHNAYRRGEHWKNDVGCTDCHSPHWSAKAAKEAGPPSSPSRTPASTQSISAASSHANDLAPPKMLIKPQPQLCISCHNETKAQFTKPFHHKVLEGAMNCSDCHNPHGGFESKQARLSGGSDAACIKCHSDKQGPFVFEHAPLKVEGCAACHDPHGSGNPKLLKRADVRQLCLECHSNAGEVGAPNTPSFHNQATARFQNCTTCHAKIHGSNTHPFFFR